MRIDLIYKIKSNPLYLRYIHENSYWYKILNRDPNLFLKFDSEVKSYYKLRPSDKIEKAISTFEMINTIISTLKS